MHVYLFVQRQGGIGFICFWTVVLALVPPPTGIHCCLFGHSLRPLTSPNGWLIPVRATVGPLTPFFPPSDASLWTQRGTPPIIDILVRSQVTLHPKNVKENYINCDSRGSCSSEWYSSIDCMLLHIKRSKCGVWKKQAHQTRQLLLIRD